MKQPITLLAKSLRLTRLPRIASYLLKDEAISGKLILVAVAAALIFTNTPLSSWYESFWNTHLSIGVGQWSISLDLRHWVNDALMAIFFLVVGLELKRELINGELRHFKTAVLPIAAALGGMIVPALIYISFNLNGEGFKGWAIPMATDIAIVIGILALLGKRIPSSIRLFLLTLAIVDDIAAVVVIAVFYNTDLHIIMLAFAAILSIATIVLQKMKRLPLALFVVIAIVLWLLIFSSGIHPSIAGALVGLLAPLSLSSKHKKSIAERLERHMIPISTLIVVPLFAFANAGIVLSIDSLGHASALPIASGIIIGLVVGKAVGIVGASWILIKIGISQLPTDAKWGHVIGVGILAGIGFTVSIFVTELAFDQPAFIVVSKLSIFIASIISGVIGFTILMRVGRRSKRSV